MDLVPFCEPFYFSFFVFVNTPPQIRGHSRVNHRIKSIHHHINITSDTHKERLLPLRLAVARQQQGRNDNDNESRARLVQGDLFGPFSSNEKWDLIVSNPPYLSEKDWKEVQEELKFEPRKALDGGKDGLDFYRRIIEGAQSHLTSDGLLALEVGGQAGPPIPTGTAQSAVVRHAVKSRTSSSAERARFNKNRALRGLDAPSSQAETVSKWLHDAGYDNIQRFNDHLQVQRVLTARRHS